MNDETRTLRKTPRRRCISLLTCALIVSGLGFHWWYHHVGPGYYSELDAVRGHLKRLAKVELLELNWRDDRDFPLLPHLCHISARIRVTGKGEMSLQNLSEKSFHESPHLIIGSIGSNTIRYRGEGYRGVYRAATGEPVRSQFAGGGIDVGLTGDFANLFPFKIANVQTAVARYQEIAEIVGTWPKTPAPPGSFAAADGTDYYYWVVPNGVNETGSRRKSDPNWHQPFAQLRSGPGIGDNGRLGL